MTTPFEKELTELINKHSMESTTDTPDYLLAEYLMGCLQSFTNVNCKRTAWYSHNESSLFDLLRNKEKTLREGSKPPEKKPKTLDSN